MTHCCFRGLSNLPTIQFGINLADSKIMSKDKILYIVGLKVIGSMLHPSEMHVALTSVAPRHCEFTINSIVIFIPSFSSPQDAVQQALAKWQPLNPQQPVTGICDI